MPTKKELQARCRAAGIACSGTKAQLEERLQVDIMARLPRAPRHDCAALRRQLAAVQKGLVAQAKLNAVQKKKHAAAQALVRDATAEMERFGNAANASLAEFQRLRREEDRLLAECHAVCEKPGQPCLSRSFR